MSDASIAEPEPTPPIDIPTSALASTGESFIPSPTNATFPFVPLYFSNSFSSSEYFWSGNISASNSLIPSSSAICFAAFLLSPVNILVTIPLEFRACIASFVPCFASSFSRIEPTNSSSIFK